MILPAYKAALGGQLKNRPGPARASASFSPTFHVGSFHTRDTPITQYELSNHKSEISFPPTPPRLAPPPVGGVIFRTTFTSTPKVRLWRIGHSDSIPKVHQWRIRYSFFPFFLWLLWSTTLFYLTKSANWTFVPSPKIAIFKSWNIQHLQRLKCG